MRYTLLPIALALAGPACDCDCIDNPFTEEIACDGAACIAAGSGGDGETDGPPDAVCSEYLAPQYDHQFMTCGGDYSEGEHCVQGAADTLGITDYALESSSATFAVKFDFIAIPIVDDPDEPDADWWGWSKNYLTALPGVITHEDNGKLYAGVASRGCCAQRVVDGVLDAPPTNPECASGFALQDTPLAWCLPMLDGTAAGLCVFPCSVDNDCANPSGEFCDLTRPDPYNLAPGVCRYKSMPTIPTAEADIGN